MRKIFVLLLCYFSLYVYSQDVFYAGTAEIIYPKTTTNIELVDVDISIEFENDAWNVSVSYEFFNPNEKSTQEILFSSKNTIYRINDPRFDGRLSDVEILGNGLKKTVSEQIKDTTDFYSFLMDFNEGKNIIIQAFHIMGKLESDPWSSTIHFDLENIKKWQGKAPAISAKINFNTDAFIYDYSNFFQFEGYFKKGSFSLNQRFIMEYIYINGGSLVYSSAKNKLTVPSFSVHAATWGGLANEYLVDSPHITMANLIVDDIVVRKTLFFLTRLTTQQLQFLINAIYAWNGYRFTNPIIRKEFEQFAWYYPRSEMVTFTEQEEKNILTLRELLAEKKEVVK